MYQKALRIKVAALGPDHGSVGATYDNMAGGGAQSPRAALVPDVEPRAAVAPYLGVAPAHWPLGARPELAPAVVSVEALLCASPLEPLLAAHGPAARDPDRDGPPLVAELTTPPDSLDMDLFETVLPPPHAEVRGVRKLRKVWMPRRFLLLRLLRIACSAASAANTAGAHGANGGSARGESGRGSGEDGCGGAFAVEAV